MDEVLVRVSVELVFFDEEEEVVAELEVDAVEGELGKGGVTLAAIHWSRVRVLLEQ